MANFTETTNYSFKKPTVGADTDQWGTHLNETIDGVDSQLKTLADSITSQQLEQLGNVVNVTPVDDQFLRYNGTNWTAETVSIPSVLNDLSNVSGTPSSGDVLTYNGSAWAPASVTSAAVTDGSVTNAKLHPSLQTVIGRILVTDDDDSPTDNQILVYSTTDSEWKYADQAGSTLQTLTDVSTTGLSDGDLMKYDGTAGEFVFIDATAARTLLSVDVSGTDNSTPVTLNTTSHDYLTLSSQQITLNPIVLTDDVSGTLPIANGGTSASTASGARTALGLGGLATQSTITESQISDLQSYITASSTDTLTNKSGNISQWTNDSGYLTAETNDLTNVSGTLGTGNGGTGLSAIGTATQVLAVNSGATGLEFQTISITESQISDLQSYLTAETNDLSSSVTWANVPDANITQSSVTQHQAALSITESQISDFGSYQPSDAGLTSIAGLTTAADKMLYTTAADTYAVTTLTTAGRALLDDADAAAQRTTLGLGTAALSASGDFETAGAVSTHAALTSSVHGISNFGATLVDDADANAARTTLGLGTAATTAATDYATSSQGATADSALQDVVSDTTPQLGGNLDVNGNSIVSTSAGNISITPDTTGKIILDGLSWPIADGSADQVLKTDGAGNLSFVDQSGGGGSSEIQLNSTTFATESGGTITVSNVDSATNRQNLGLEIGVDVQQYDADTTKNDVANTFTANQIISVTDNTNAALRVTQLGTGNALVVEDSTNPDSTPFVVYSSGRVGIGTSSNYGQLDVAFSSNSGPAIVGNDTTPQNGNAFFQFRNNGTVCGSITSNGSTTSSFNSSSDYRLKTNTQPMTGVTERLKALNPINFEWISNGERVDGFLAHEVQAVVPEAVTGEKDAVNEDGSINPQGIDQSKLVPLLTAALQEAITLIESQQSQIDALTARIEALENT